MKIVVASDSHGNKNLVDFLFSNEKFDCFVFCGDGIDDFTNYFDDSRLEIVSGNCDWFSNFFDEKTLVLCNRKIFVTHGHKYFVKNSLEKLAKVAKKIGAEIVLYGHTHKQYIKYIDGVYLVNPGTLKKGQYVVFELQENGVPIIEQKAI